MALPSSALVLDVLGECIDQLGVEVHNCNIARSFRQSDISKLPSLKFEKAYPF
jgi:hypothetical protein